MFAETSWFYRRWVVFGVLLFCAWAIAYLTIWGKDTALERDIVQVLGLLAGGVVGSYVFGAAWDDRNKMIHGRVDPSPLGPPAPDERG